MIVCPSSIKPVRLTIGHHPSELEVLGIKITPSHCIYSMCIVAVYRRPQQQLPVFLSLLGSSLPLRIPTVILGDFTSVAEIKYLDDDRQLQTVQIADKTGKAKLDLWQNHIGTLLVAKNYHIKNAMVKSIKMSIH